MSRACDSRSFVVAALAAAAFGCGGGSGSETRYFSIAEDSRCDSVRLDVELSSGLWNPRCELTGEARDSGCAASISADSERIEAQIRGCDGLEGKPVLACSFGGGAPGEAELLDRTTITCACDCGDGCDDSAAVCVDDSELTFCEAGLLAAPALARTVRRGRECSITVGMTSSELTGAIQLRIVSLDPRVLFHWAVDDGDCESLLASDLSSVNAGYDSVEAGFLSAEGFAGPVPLLRCPVEARRGADPVPEQFQVTVVDAADPLLNPLAATAGVLDVSCAPPPEITTCRATFGMTSDDVARELQLRVDSTNPELGFVGLFETVRCRNLAVESEAAFFLRADLSLEANFVFEAGIAGPRDLFECDVRAFGRREPGEFDNRFDVTIRGAWDSDLHPIEPTIEQAGVEGCEVSFLTTSTTSTTSHHSSSTTATVVTSTTQQPVESTVELVGSSSARIESLDLRISVADGSHARLRSCTASDGVAADIHVVGRAADVCLYRRAGIVLGDSSLVRCVVVGDDPELDVEVRRVLDDELRPADASFEIRRD